MQQAVTMGNTVYAFDADSGSDVKVSFWLGGRWSKRTAEAKLATVLKINPHEVHILDDVEHGLGVFIMYRLSIPMAICVREALI